MAGEVFAALILAGGSGVRMKGVVGDKVLAPLAGRPVIEWSIRAMLATERVASIVVVCQSPLQREALSKVVADSGLSPDLHFADAGPVRADSVRSGLRAVPDTCTHVLIHDGARPLIRPETICRLLDKAAEHGNAVSCRPVTDTIKQVPESLYQESAATSLETPDRSRLRAMETPQVFRLDQIRSAYEHATGPLTDDASAVEYCGQKILLVPDNYPNPKITFPHDWITMEALARKLRPNAGDDVVSPFRIGHGYDIHRLAKGRRLVLGGVTIDSELGLLGHSDADVLTHALADALLGACGLPDIGHWFPNDDPGIEGINSLEILRRAVDEARQTAYRTVNADISVIAEAPKIAPCIAAMRSALAPILQVPEGAIGIKATTNEKVGSLGAGEAIAAHAIVLMQSTQLTNPGH